MNTKGLQRFEKAQASRLLETENRELREVIRALERKLCGIQSENNAITDSYEKCTEELSQMVKFSQDQEAIIENQREEI
eukprot:CAMPEP_0115034890 /NCGR_PEP_ID=MMETSP0216-20121206/41012_1 /TAXON_ID=223996 /ORGANISM="Protocruzia adherens, Strain Boccale" /LENGTH=78 /DNA_ID=CAMNT_0002414045 /DNA_START=54 /DNA_END=287 /DNA_ORIENTATION=+